MMRLRRLSFELSSTKAPGPDCFSGSFYQSNWDLITLDLYNVVRNFYIKGYLVNEFNRINIVLISKCVNPIAFSQYRPISLCNFIYKVISKSLNNQLKLWMTSLISQTKLFSFHMRSSLKFNIF